MKNLVIFGKMLKEYERLSFTNHYIWGFIYKKVVYMAITTNETLPVICTLDRASRGAGYALRFRPTIEQKLFLLPKATPICSEDFFNSEVANSKYNSGEIFEKMITESYGLEWVKDRVPFTEAGDIEVNGIAYQIKFQKATFCNEKTLANLDKGITK